VPEGMSVKESHDICNLIEKEISNTLSNTSVLIHIEPAEENEETKLEREASNRPNVH
jgi:divalent metal cation (Fe/Co/Zn/Cd) transporter